MKLLSIEFNQFQQICEYMDLDITVNYERCSIYSLMYDGKGCIMNKCCDGIRNHVYKKMKANIYADVQIMFHTNSSSE